MIVGFCRNNCRVSMSGNLRTCQSCDLWNQRHSSQLSGMSESSEDGSVLRILPLEVWGTLPVTCRNLLIKRDLNDVAHIR